MSARDKIIGFVLINNYQVMFVLLKVSALNNNHKSMEYEPHREKTGICKNKDADQLRGDREADQRLCFRYTDSTVPLLP